MRVDYLPAALAAMGLFAACHEPTAAPARPLFSTVAATACPTPSNVIVTNEADLRAALSAATPGYVIGLDGFFGVAADVIVGSPDVTLTCATPGSGIFPQPGFSGAWLLQVHATGVTVDRLVLDGGAVEGPYVAGADAHGLFVADGAQLTNNRVTCGSPNGECAFFVGTKNAVVADNRFESAGSGTGVHMQGGIGGTRVERNTIVTTAPPPDQVLGAGIRVRDGSNVVVADNVVRGPWRNSIATANLAGTFERNDVAGALGNAVRTVGVHDVLFSHNTVSCGAQSCALFEGTGGDTRTTIADNRFEYAGSVEGVQLRNMDGAQVARNSVVSTAAGGEGIFATGIAATGGANLAVTDNVVSGPWTDAALSFDGVFAARIERNQLSGAFDDGVELFGSAAAQFLNNTVQCALDCFFADGSPRAVIADNHFESGGSFTGVHLQAGTDSDRVERNTIVATAPSTAFGFGAIRVRDGSHVVIADNIRQGPWSNSIATTTLSASRFENNTLQGAAVNGIRFNVGTAEVPIAMVDNIFQNNRASGAGDAGIFAQAACRNTFDGNDLSGNGGNIGAVFEATTGANVMFLPLSNRSVTIDNGFFACDGDGRVDPNRIVGLGPRRRMPVPPRPDVVAGSLRRRYR